MPHSDVSLSERPWLRYYGAMEDFWSIVKKTEKPVVMYGTGDAADKLYSLLEKKGVKVRGCFVNDEFVRSRTFHGFKVLSYQTAKRIFGDMCVVLGYGTHRREVMEQMLSVSREQEFYVPDLLQDEEGHLFDGEYLERHHEEIEWAYSLLSDEQSRLVYRSVLESKLTGRVEPLLASETDEMENWKLLEIGDKEVFMDLGAYNGDTIARFLTFTKAYDKIVGVEPEERNYRKLVEATKGYPRTELYQVGIGEKDGSGIFSEGKGRGSHLLGEGRAIPFRSIDSLLNGERVTLLKFDIEGQEPMALRGAKNTIRTYKPKMVLSAYHRIDDFWSLPKIITEYRGDYVWKMRHSPCIPAWEVEYYLT